MAAERMNDSILTSVKKMLGLSEEYDAFDLDIINRNDDLLNPEYLISTVLNTHNAIHYGDSSLLPHAPVERRKNDTCPWRH